MTQIILILSGKGGCGKSSCTSILAHQLSKTKHVGILDVDLCGPSQSRMMGCLNESIRMSESGWEPVFKHNVYIMSISFLMENQDDPVIWRGPKKNALIMQFISQTNWPELDVLLIDCPPGTSDEHLTLVEYLQANDLRNNKDSTLSSIIVTTPQKVAVNDVKKELMFCHRVGLPVLGVIENMSGYVCPHCDVCSHLFSKKKHVEEMCEQFNVKLLDKLPILPEIGYKLDRGQVIEKVLLPECKVAIEANR
eukprot:NODE_245_length_11874_cov_0.539546.p5 type:complete len:251 gc:universal NODE_245_length_11874_cov_0.539546:11697-10945(-)